MGCTNSTAPTSHAHTITTNPVSSILFPWRDIFAFLARNIYIYIFWMDMMYVSLCRTWPCVKFWCSHLWCVCVCIVKPNNDKFELDLISSKIPHYSSLSFNHLLYGSGWLHNALSPHICIE